MPQRNQRGVTSSRNRSTRSSSKPVTQGQNPQRSNRQSVSQARVTTSQQRSNRQRSSTASVTRGSNGKPTNTRGGGSARVTQGRSAGPTTSDARRWQELNKQAARNAPKPTPPRTPAPGTGNVERTAIQRGQAERERQRLATRQERLSRNNLGRPISRGLSRGAAPTAIAGALLNTPAEIKKLQALLKDPGGTIRRASNQFLSGNTNRSVLGATKPTSKPSKPSAGGVQGPSMPSRLREQGYAAQEKKARQRLEARKKATGSKEATPNTAKSFDSAFKDARRAGVKTFTWRGKKYTTEMK